MSYAATASRPRQGGREFALVTGAGGFLGRYVVEQLLARGDRVRTLARGHYPDLATAGAETIRGDLQDPECVWRACEGVDVVHHTAGVAGIWGPWRHFHGINTVGTLNLLEACRRRGVPKLVYTSSPSVTFAGTDQCGVDETAPYPSTWLCHYPHSKALAEQAVLDANGQDGLFTCALRPHLIWGPRDQHLIPRLLDRARRGRLRRIGDGTNLIDMIYVENAATAQLQAADQLATDSPVCGQAYFLSQGEPVNCWDWMNSILALVHLPPVTRSLSLSRAWLLGRWCERLYTLLRLPGEPPMTRFLAAQLGTSHYFDIRRAREDFGYQAQIDTATGMRRLAQWLRQGQFDHTALKR